MKCVFMFYQRSISTNSNESEPNAEQPKPSKGEQPKKGAKRSKVPKGSCGCRTGCKLGQCGCRKQSMTCTESCNCRMECQNVFNRTGSLKRDRSMDDEVSSTNIEDKENADEVVVCTPKKAWYVFKRKLKFKSFSLNLSFFHQILAPKMT